MYLALERVHVILYRVVNSIAGLVKESGYSGGDIAHKHPAFCQLVTGIPEAPAL